MLAPAVVIVALVGALAIGSVKVLGAVRGYVGGESLWSKARSEAVQHLRDYASSHDPSEFAQFEAALKVPLGDRRAREGLMQAHPDMAAIRQGFKDGGNHPDDIDGMIQLFLYFGQQDLFRPSILAWVDGDRLIAQLQETAQRLKQQIGQQASPADIKATLARVNEINIGLFQAEITFSRHLAHASRITEQILIGTMALTVVALSVAGYVVMRRGLHRQQAYQQDLRRANRRWELAVVGAELGLFDMDVDGSEITLDAQAAALYGLDRHAVTLPGRTLLESVVPEDRRRADQLREEAATGRSLFRLTMRIVLPDGQSRYLETIGSLSDNGAASKPRLTGVVRDVTQEKARARLAIERDAAEKVASSQRIFLSRLSHELRTPLNAILGFAQLLSMDHLHPLPPTQHKQVDWILDAGQQLLKLVEDVLDLSKVEAGEIGMSLQDCDLGTVLDNSLILIDPARQARDISIINRVSGSTLRVAADAQRLQQVLINLLTNACKYNKPGGHVTIDAHETHEQVSIDIADNGIGLTPEDAASLFQPFRRIAAASVGVEGSGLGLYIVKQLVERMGGSVAVSSKPGVGSRFTVCLPRTNPPQDEPDNRAASSVAA
ncbi:ATP-binding protein [Aquabacterium sp.]|uniref:ATP-binding protein n=1 Tax=Aquabacterium sp. TaxID=1872578 RepID=UPI004037F3DC